MTTSVVAKIAEEAANTIVISTAAAIVTVAKAILVAANCLIQLSCSVGI